MKEATENWLRKATMWAFFATGIVLIWLTWFKTPNWAYQPDVTAPLTRKILFYHPASAWASFVAYFLVFVNSVAFLNERRMRFDAPAAAAAEVGFGFNTVALITGTLWGIQEWSRTGEASLLTVYSEPKVLVVLLMWFAFAAYLLLRKLTDGAERRARLSAIFGVLGFVGVPLSFATSRILQTSLHPDVAGPGKNPDAAVGAWTGFTLSWSMLVFVLLLLHLWLQRLRILRLQGDYHVE